MGLDSMMLLVRRVAMRNNLYLFAWLCAIGLPWGMQYLAGASDEVQSYMAGYYGSLSLFMFFGLTYGFATVFVSFYVVSSLRRAGTLDMLRVSSTRPSDVVMGYFWQMQRILVPPAIAFMGSFAIWSYYTASQSREVWSFGWQAIAGGALSFLLGQAVLVALMGVVLFRVEFLWTIMLAVLVLPINFAPVVLVYALHLPMPLFIALYVVLVSVSLFAAVRSVNRLWPPSKQVMDRL